MGTNILATDFQLFSDLNLNKPIRNYLIIEINDFIWFHLESLFCDAIFIRLLFLNFNFVKLIIVIFKHLDIIKSFQKVFWQNITLNTAKTNNNW